MFNKKKPNDVSVVQNTVHTRSSINFDTSNPNIKMYGSDQTYFSSSEDILSSMGIDILRNIATFLTIPDYLFNFLQINKNFNHLLSPYISPNIMEQLIITNPLQQFDCFNQDTFEKGIVAFIDSIDINERLEEWQIIATLAW